MTSESTHTYDELLRAIRTTRRRWRLKVLLRGLAVLPYGETFEDVAVDSCRTNILQLLEAIATNNPYPARHFPELNFNQMVMKCLFNGVPLAKVVDLDGRLNAELKRMAESYASERQAAGRPVPADIQLAVAYAS